MFLFRRGKSIADAVRLIGTTVVTYYGWRKEYGGLKTAQVKPLRELETENARLRWTILSLRKRPGELLSPRLRRACIDHIRIQISVS